MWQFKNLEPKVTSASMLLDKKFFSMLVLLPFHLQVTGRSMALACLGFISQILIRLVAWTLKNLKTAGEEKTGSSWTGEKYSNNVLFSVFKLSSTDLTLTLISREERKHTTEHYVNVNIIERSNTSTWEGVTQLLTGDGEYHDSLIWLRICAYDV